MVAFSRAPRVLAAPTQCAASYQNFSFGGNWPAQAPFDSSYAPLTVTFSGVPVGQYKITCAMEKWSILYSYFDLYQTTLSTTADPSRPGLGVITWNVTNNSCFAAVNGAARDVDWDAFIKIEPVSNASLACTATNYRLLSYYQGLTCAGSNFTFGNSQGTGCFEAGESLNWSISGATIGSNPANRTVTARYSNATPASTEVTIANGAASGTVTLATGATGQNFTVTLQESGTTYCSASVPIRAVGSCTPDDRDDPQPPTGPGTAPPFELCDQAANPQDKGRCQACVGQNAIWTAFGCIQTSKEGIVTSLVRVGIGVAGGFVLLSILYGAFLVSTSAGEPKRIQEGQEMISSAVMGLLFVIFSIIILRFIGVSILRIPGFGG